MIEVLKVAGTKFVEYAATLPVSGVIKLGVMAGIAVFTGVIMIKRAIKMYKEAHAEKSSRRSPVDDILGVNYVTNPEAFDDLDPEAQRICRKLNKSAKKRKKPRKFKFRKKPEKQPKPAKNAEVVSLFDDDDPFGKQPTFYGDANEMMWGEKRKGKGEGKKPKRRRVVIDKEHLEALKAICEEWKTSGLDAEYFRDRIDAIAKELGLPVDTLDQAISESTRREFGALF